MTGGTPYSAPILETEIGETPQRGGARASPPGSLGLHMEALIPYRCPGSYLHIYCVLSTVYNLQSLQGTNHISVHLSQQVFLPHPGARRHLCLWPQHWYCHSLNIIHCKLNITQCSLLLSLPWLLYWTVLPILNNTEQLGRTKPSIIHIQTSLLLSLMSIVHVGVILTSFNSDQDVRGLFPLCVMGKKKEWKKKCWQGNLKPMAWNIGAHSHES